MSESIAQRPGLDPMDQALLQAAHDVRLCAYAPYSKFRVGAAVRTELGVFTGVNVENASYPLTVCAERNAIATAIAAGARHVEAVAVAAETEGPASPCGACRQVISEHGPGADLILASTFGPYMKTTIDQLLPHAFGPTDVPGYDAAFGAPPAEPSEHTAVPHVQGGEAQDALPLAGLKILDLTRILAGPFATQRLADLGATVWKIENPKGGDDTRGWGPPFHGGISTYFLSVNRNKRSVAIDLKHEAGKALLWQLIEQADVLVENFRPGTLGRLGFGWDEVSRRSPRLIYCSVSGYGHQSAYRARPSYDVVVQGESGVMDLTGDPEGPPTKCGLSIADLVAGMNAVQGILAAVHRRHLTGRGGRVDIALFDGMLAMLAYQGQMQLSVGKRPRAHKPRRRKRVPVGALLRNGGSPGLAGRRALCAQPGPRRPPRRASSPGRNRAHAGHHRIVARAIERSRNSVRPREQCARSAAAGDRRSSAWPDRRARPPDRRQAPHGGEPGATRWPGDAAPRAARAGR
jgi:homotetrameric cytidine deaminase